ncbi:phage baseplate assembly protein V [Kitasatospora sp. NPDC052896]|uniref:phage baseplate assembly protein V n=1 Tax=Kitasatospora sp. NPDC052896 TaxID=3364061 RepID=UPI0037CC1D34
MASTDGTYTATVVDTNDPAGQGRVRLLIPQIHGTAITGWARPAAAGQVLPGDRVYAAYDGGDPNWPLYWPSRPVVPALPTPAEIGAAVAPGPWAPLTMASGWASNGTPDPVVAARWVGTDVQLTGVATYTAGTALTAGTYYTVASLPRSMIPGFSFNAPVAVSWSSGQSFSAARCKITSGSAAVQILIPQTLAISWVSFESCTMRTV